MPAACDNVEMRRTALVLTLALAAGCGGSSSKPAAEPAAGGGDSAEPAAEPGAPGKRPLEEDLPALVTAAVEMFESVGAALATTGPDCAASTAKLKEQRGRYDGLITAARRAETDGHGEEIERLLEPHKARVAAAIEKMRPSVEACIQTPEFARAFEDLTGAGSGQ